ncbi:putative inactive cadmium/zinc-transporting ATPase HMA3 [Juglans microcarpa x Juglans regia]|uniref:putative inactive cadmium/zinc-transporting ATPase HMA3 n=1 Tax=Juglans microcarpa x Juglans regia TaxID=2249226 RepID=UPI001B7F6064|nr:putative inactive cadmium/zinc-transporting ATPase HMA3 [Juglans microcarpa x Juglans regia]
MAENLKKSYFEVLGLCCASEVTLVERILKSLNGVKEISVILPTKTLIVVHDTVFISEIQVVDALNKARLEATVRPKEESSFQNRWPAPSTMVCGLLLALSFLKYIYHPLGWLALAAVIVGLPSLVLRSIASIRNLTLNINILVLMAVVGTLALQDYWEAGTVVFLYSIAQWLESRASYKAMATMSSLMSMAPQKATIAETGEHVDVNVVELDTVLAVKAGNVIPLDGVIVEGKCEVDEKMLTGESFPVTKELYSPVLAGTININGYINLKTTALAKDSVVARMAKLVEEAHKKKSKTQRFIDNCAKYYIPVVMLISCALAVIPAALRLPNENRWFHLAIVVLVSTCPCALILSTPVAIFCALSKAATNGLLVKGGDYLEILARVKIAAFDKTGTITRGEFVVTDFRAINDDVSLSTLLHWVSSIESKSSHPMAAALVDYARLHSIEPKPENVEDFQNFPGEGVFGKIDGHDIYIGNRRIGLRSGHGTVESHKMKGNTDGYVYSGTTLVGIFSLSDSCRSGAMEAIEEMTSLGIKSVMLTGDSHTAAMLAQDQLNHALDVIHSELLPADKARIIEDYKKEGPTVMIGDGMNDAPALATADVGISMGISGSALAMETGHVILMSNDIRKIPKAIQLARRTLRKLIENVIISISTKGAILALAFAGYPLIWAAVLTDVGTCLIVILNSMLLLQETSKSHEDFARSSYGTFTMTSSPKEKSTTAVGGKGTYDGGYHIPEAKICNDKCRCCKEVIHYVESPSVSNPTDSGLLGVNLLGKHQITNLVGRQGGGNNKFQTVKQCSDGCGDKGPNNVRNCGHSDGVELDNDACTCLLPRHELEPCNNVASTDRGCSNCTEINCKYDNFEDIADSSKVCYPQNSEAQSQQRKCCSGCGVAQGATIINTASTTAHGLEISIVTDDSMIAKIRECCKQSGEQCCGKLERQCGAGFVDSLSEIVIN